MPSQRGGRELSEHRINSFNTNDLPTWWPSLGRPGHCLFVARYFISQRAVFHFEAACSPCRGTLPQAVLKDGPNVNRNLSK